jgi:hypothetical protein
MTVIPINPADLRRTASPLGEADPIKFIQTLPGVSTGMEGSSAYYVRGGNEGNNLTTLDGIPIYGTGHLLGLTTSYPSEIVSGQDFYAGGFPSDVGGYTSSLLQLTTSDGDFEKTRSRLFVNNFLAGALLSKPLNRNKSSLIASVRVSPLGLEYNLLRPLMDEGLPVPEHINALVGDAFAKITWKTRDRERIFLSVFGSYDRYGFDPTNTSSQALGWSNLIGNLTWIKESASGWEWETRLSHNGFRAFQDQTQKINSNTTRMSLQSALMEEGLQTKVSSELNARLRVQTGADAYVSFFQPGVSKVYQGNELAATAGKSLITGRGSLHGQIGYNNGHFHATAGVRGTVFPNVSTAVKSERRKHQTVCIVRVNRNAAKAVAVIHFVAAGVIGSGACVANRGNVCPRSRRKIVLVSQASGNRAVRTVSARECSKEVSTGDHSAPRRFGGSAGNRGKRFTAIGTFVQRRCSRSGTDVNVFRPAVRGLSAACIKKNVTNADVSGNGRAGKACSSGDKRPAFTGVCTFKKPCGAGSAIENVRIVRVHGKLFACLSTETVSVRLEQRGDIGRVEIVSVVGTA